MATVAPSGEISEGKTLAYDQVVKQFGALESKLDGLMSLIKEVNVKLEQQDSLRKRQALLSQRIALRRASNRKVEEEEEAKKKREEDEATKRKILEKLKSRLQEVKSKVEESRKQREASATSPATAIGKGNVGEVKEENSALAAMGISTEIPAEFKELMSASDKFKSLGLLSG
jgi:hypothetical protein